MALTIVGASRCADPVLHPAKHRIVFQQPGRFAGWPANHGMWSWGQEILAGFDLGAFEYSASGHSVDSRQAVAQLLARSLDGGTNWTMEQPRELATPSGLKYQNFPSGNGPAIQDGPADAIDFQREGFAFTARMTGNPGISRFYYSYNRGRSWTGPFRLPDFGHRGSAARTDYLVNGKHDMLLFTTLAKADGLQGRVACTRTQDGGRTWSLVSYIGAEPPAGQDFAIMPSTLRLGPATLFTAIRRPGSIEAYRSLDDGKTWTPEGKIGPGRTPPSLVRLGDGRLVLIYGYRRPPFGIRARVSEDRGASWGEELVLRADGGNADLGYTRSIVRPDGMIVTTYYYNTDPHKERFIAATIWRP